MAEQPKKAGAKDISDLKARLGLKQPGAPAGAPAGPGRPVGPASRPGAASAPPGGAGGHGASAAPARSVAPASSSVSSAPAHSAPPAAHDPFASIKPKAGEKFDLRLVDDGKPVESVQGKGGKGALVITGIVSAIAFGVGAGFGMATVDRKLYNSANAGAKVIKSEIETMQKTVAEIGRAVAMSQQRLAGRDVLAYDGGLTNELEKVKLDTRPDTSKIFRVNYMRLEDVLIDRMFNYYYDTIALYGEVERHVKKTKADRESLETAAQKQGDTQKQANYGIVFDNSGKLVVAHLVEVGKPVCKNGGSECAAADYDGFEVRAAIGSSWAKRKIGGKSDDRMVPLKPTPLLDSVMSGSPEQVRAEAYKQRVAGIRSTLARVTAAHKELNEGITKAAGRPDLFTLF